METKLNIKKTFLASVAVALFAGALISTTAYAQKN